MTRRIPADPKFASPGRAGGVGAAASTPCPATRLCSPTSALVDRDFDHEADLVVLLPDRGVVVLEVKGGSVCYDGEWHQSGHAIHPTEQALRVKYALREYVEGDPRWSRGRDRVGARRGDAVLRLPARLRRRRTARGGRCTTARTCTTSSVGSSATPTKVRRQTARRPTTTST